MKNIYKFSAAILISLLMSVITFDAQAQVIKSFTQRTSVYSPTQKIYNIRGDFTMIGNSNMTLGSYTDGGNNSDPMVYVDVDDDPYTLNSSSAYLSFSGENSALPQCTDIVFAGLYWTGRAHDGNSPMTFSVEKAGGPDVPEPFDEDQNVYNSWNVNHTNYGLSISSSGSNNNRVVTYLFEPDGSGDTYTFVYSYSSVTVKVNNGTPTTLTISQNGDYTTATLTTPYVIYQSGDLTVSVKQLKRNRFSNYATVNATGIEMVPGTITKNYDKRVVQLKHESESAYYPVTANANDIYFPTSEHGYMYSAYAEVTDYVRTHGTGNYFVADMALNEGSGGGTGYYGGWGMVVVYGNAKMNWRDITIFDGHAYVQGSTTISYELPITGFNTVQHGNVHMKLGVIAGEGDRSISGDYFQIQKLQTSDWVSLSHSGNSTTNFFNGSINTGGNARNLERLNNFGLDVAMFDIPNTDNTVITNNQSSTKFRYGSTQDTYIIPCIVMGVDAYIPVSEGLVSVEEVDNNPPATPITVLPNGDIEYKVKLRNRGTEPINNLQVTIPIPYAASFVSASGVFMNGTSGPQPIYNASAGATGTIIWDFGTMPLPADPSTVYGELTFVLKATSNCVILINENCTPKITIDGSISGVGATSQISFSNTDFITGYIMDGDCIGEPINEPVEIEIDMEEYVLANCEGYSSVQEFDYCNAPGTTIPFTDVNGNFPLGSRFYNEYPLVEPYTEYTVTTGFPATTGETHYFAIPPGLTDCYFEFIINVTTVNSVPTVTSPVIYCQGVTASPLTATPSNPSYNLYYFTTPTGGSAQTSITPSTAIAGTTTYYVAEGYSAQCISGNRVPIVISVTATPAIPVVNNQTVCPAVDGTLAYEATALAGHELLWYENATGGEPLSGVPSANIETIGTYTAYVSQQMTESPYCESPRTAVTITVADNEAPQITNCESLIDRNVEANTGATYTHSGTAWDATASDNCSYVLTAALTGATTGSDISTLNNVVFNEGTTTVTWTATDLAGQAAVCEFDVVVAASADLAIVKTAGTAQTGQELVYTLVVTNNGPAAAQNVLITDDVTGIFPTGAQYSTDNSTWEVWTGSYTYTGPLASAGTFTIYIKGTVPANTCNTINNTATVSSNWADPNPDNNSSQISTSVIDIIDPVIECEPGQTITVPFGESYTINGTEFDATATDNCTLASIVNDKNSTSTIGGEVLAPGTHIISWTATDAAGRKATCTTTIIIRETPIYSVVKSDVTCFGLGNGTITITAEGGTAPYYYSINGSAYEEFLTPKTISDLGPGSYGVLVKDSNDTEAICQ